MTRIVIVGAGLAGLRAAERLRELDFDDEIVVLGAESAMPYHRPALSKQFLTGALSSAELTIEPLDELDAVWRLNTPVSRLDPESHTLELPGGESLDYDGLVLATGVEARRLNGGMSGHPRVVSLRTIGDAVRLQRALAGNRLPVVVLGGGFTGCEVAATLRTMGREVTLVARRSLMAGVLEGGLGERLVELHVRHGVDLRVGAGIEDWRLGSSRMVTVGLSTGETIEAAAVVTCVGSVPAVSWLRDSGVVVDDGIVCEPTCHVVGQEDVVSAGDVAQWPNLRFDSVPRRTEHWTNAIEMGRAAAENLLAGRDAASAFTPVPRFWSEQFGLRIQAAGAPALGDRTVPVGSASGGERVVTAFARGDQPVGVVGFNSSSAVLASAEELLQKRRLPIDGQTGPAQRRRTSFLQAVRNG